MKETIILVFTALCSGLIATGVTIYWQKKDRANEEKRRIFTTLMSKRYYIAAEESVEALNMVDIVFYRSEKVRTALKEFIEATNAIESPTKNQTILELKNTLMKLKKKNHYKTCDPYV